MRSSILKKFADESLRSGLTTFFTTISAIAFVNLMDEIIFEQSHMPSIPTFLLALFTSGVISAISVVRSQKLSQLKSSELKMAQSLSFGDLSESIMSTTATTSHLQIALAAIAEHQLNTERKYQLLMQEANIRQTTLSATLDCLPEELAVFNKDGLLLYANFAYLNRCAQIGAVVALGMTRFEILSEIAKAPQTGLPLNERQSWIKNQNELRTEATSAIKPIRYARTSNEIVQFTCETTNAGHELEITSDVSAVLLLEERTQCAERQAIATVRQKQFTLTNLSHTIRTPMNGVLAAAELLRDTELDDKQRQRLDIIRRSAGTLLGVVQDMFELATVPQKPDVHDIAPPLKPQQAVFSTASCDVASNAKDPSGQNGLPLTRSDLSGNMDDSSPALLQIDTRHVAGSDADARDSVTIAFDQEGLAARPDLKLLSEILSQTEDKKRSAPLKHKQATDCTHQRRDALPLDVLIAESSDVGQIYFSNYLTNSSYNFKIYGTGADALEAIHAKLPQLILLDIALPDIDALSVTQKIRDTIAENNSDYTPVIIGMSSNFVRGDLIKCIKAGMDHYASKPVTQDEVQSLISNWLRGEPLRIAS